MSFKNGWHVKDRAGRTTFPEAREGMTSAHDSLAIGGRTTVKRSSTLALDHITVPLNKSGSFSHKVNEIN